MPYKFDTEKKKVGKNNDRRIKLTDAQREEIRRLYGTISQRKLACMYGVSRRLIIFIGCPEKHQKNLQNRADRGGSRTYYHAKKQKEYIKNHRNYKKELDKEGLLE